MNEIEQGELNEQFANAVKEGNEDMIWKLSDLGADANAFTNDDTPLHMAVDHIASLPVFTSIVRVLIELGADMDLENWDGLTPMGYAGFNGHTREENIMLQFYALSGKILCNSDRVDVHYLDQCKDEVQEMQNEKIGNSDVSLCKFLLETDPNKLAGCVYDINIEGLKDKYPTYADMIESQHDKGMEKRALLLSSEEVIKHHFSKGDAIPKYLTERFAEAASSILTDKDVKNLRKLQDKKDEKVLFSKGAQALQYCAAENGVTLPEDQARRLVETMMSSTLKDIDVKNLIKLTAPKIAQRPL